MKNWNMGHWWNDTDKENPKIVVDKLVPLPHFLPHIPRGLALGRTRSSEVRGRRLTVWVMESPTMKSECHKSNSSFFLSCKANVRV
jgi:hypothetical protein